MPPDPGPGEICQIQIPADDVDRSVRFYETVFSWNIRWRSNGEVAFDDTVGEVSGTGVTGRPPFSEPGLVVYVMVESVAETLETIREAGGEVVTPLTRLARIWATCAADGRRIPSKASTSSAFPVAILRTRRSP